jgi:hypothetical protein
MFTTRRFGSLSALLLAITLAPVNAATFGLCDVDVPQAALAPDGGNAIVHVAMLTCSVDDFTIVEASLDGDSPFDIGPIAGNDSAAIDAALLEAANLLGQDPASLDAVMLSLLSETVDVVEEMASASSNTPALFGTDYLGTPDDYDTWIAIGTWNVEVAVSLATVTSRTYRLDLASAAAPLPGTTLLRLAGLGVMRASRHVARTRKRSHAHAQTTQWCLHAGEARNHARMLLCRTPPLPCVPGNLPASDSGNDLVARKVAAY